MYIRPSTERDKSGAIRYEVICDSCKKNFTVRKRALKHLKHYCRQCFTSVIIGKKYDSLEISISCHICDKNFLVETKWYHYRLRKGKNRFACSKKCRSKLKSITIKEVRSTNESRAKTVRQLNRRWSDPEERRRYGAIIKSKPLEWHQRRLAATLRSTLSQPTKPERIFMDIIKRDNLPFKYVGNGKLWIGKLNPDFVATDGSKRLVEVFGCYWHGCWRCFPGSKSKGIPLNQRLTTFKKHGYTTKIVWEHELKPLS